MKSKRYITVVFFIALVIPNALFSGHAQEINSTGNEDEFSQLDESDPAYLFNKAQDFHAAGDFEKALEFYNKALKVKPDFPEAEYQRSMIFELIGKPAMAIASLKLAIGYAEDWSLPKIALASILFKSGTDGEIPILLNSALSFDAGNPDALTLLGEFYLQTNNEKDLRTTLTDIQRFSASDETPISLLIIRARAERRLGMSPAALETLRRVLLRKPTNYVALSEKVENLIALEENKNALDSARFVAETYPQAEQAQVLYARTLLLNQKQDSALKQLRKISNPSDETAQFIRAVELNETTDVAELSSLLKKNPNNVKILGALCAYSRTENPAAAIDYCMRALTLAPTNINYAIGYGAALVQMKRYADAAGVLTNLLKHEPRNFTIHANLATALFQLQRFDLAKTEYEWIIKTKPETSIAFYFLGICYDRLTEFELAKESYDKFLSVADSKNSQLEIEKVNLRMPILNELIKKGKGRKQ
ncbi:MAG: tetratricopeptide repeat protein [Pyrinomonadaceae bacterium]